MYIAGEYDIIVIGAGHAGVEAALAGARLKMRVLMATISMDSIALMPCNPSIGGPAKGHLVREIDALGGAMGLVADETAIQKRLLNTGKGPAVQAIRSQADKKYYQFRMKEVCENTDNLDVKQLLIEDILTKDNHVTGVIAENGECYLAKAVIIATGTYLRGRIIIGEHDYHGGPNGLRAAIKLTDSLQKLGLKLMRFKTGTPARVDGRSLDFSKMQLQEGDIAPRWFSFLNEGKEYAGIKKSFEDEEAECKAELLKLREQINKAEAELEKFTKRGRPSKAKKEHLEYLDELKQLLKDAETKEKEGRPAGKGRPRKEKFTAEHQVILDKYEESIKKIKGAKYALGKNPENRTANQDAIVELIQNSYPDLYKALQQKEELRIILHMKDADLASSKLDSWINAVSEGSIPAMKELGKKIKRHRDNILNAIRYQANSSQCESTNTTIKALIKTARGFRNLDNMIALIYLKCSDIVVPLNNRAQCDADLKAAMRARAKRLKQEREAKKRVG